MTKIKKLSFFGALTLVTILSACGGGGGGGKGCGGDGTDTCAAGEFCNYDDLSCGAAGIKGHCDAIPTDCSAEPAGAVCSCDRLAFSSQCFANAAGQSVASTGDCP